MKEEIVDRAPRERMSMADAQEYDRMLSTLEDAHDVAAAQAAIEEPGESIPWAQVKADLGL